MLRCSILPLNTSMWGITVPCQGLTPYLLRFSIVNFFLDRRNIVCPLLFLTSDKSALIGCGLSRQCGTISPRSARHNELHYVSFPQSSAPSVPVVCPERSQSTASGSPPRPSPPRGSPPTMKKRLKGKLSNRPLSLILQRIL
jgi:hypothetical protein